MDLTRFMLESGQDDNISREVDEDYTGRGQSSRMGILVRPREEPDSGLVSERALMSKENLL